MIRGAGVLAHIASFPSQCGIGDLGRNAFKVIDFLHEAKQKYLQILPITPIDGFYDYSPYHSVSAFAINPLFIDLYELSEQGFLERSQFQVQFASGDNKIHYEYAERFKLPLLEKLQDRSKLLENSEFQDFATQNSWWLEDYALFKSLKKKYNRAPWYEWPEDIMRRNKEAIESAKEELISEIALEKFIQFVAFKQWTSFREYANSKGIYIIGDIPIYVDLDSADVWANSQYFQLDSSGKPLFVAGVPPDYFSSTGQLWGNPVYDWQALMKDGFVWWKRRFEHNLKLFDVLRIDHFRGLVAFWKVPAGEATAINGEWEEVPVYDFFDSILNGSDNSRLIAEDLGIITQDVVEVMKRYCLPGMKVLQFAFDGNPDNPYLPHNYERNSVVYTGTHDNNTTRGWFEDELSDIQIRFLESYIGKTVNSESISFEMIRLAMSSVSDLAIIPVQDVAGQGSFARMNIPGTQTNNWRYAFTFEDLQGYRLEKLKEISIIYGRAT